MSLCSIEIKNEYRSLRDNMVEDFYLPLLSDAICYQRAVGFFSSTSLVELSKGIAELARKGGKIQIVASPYLSEEDVRAIQAGYQSRESVIEKALLRQMPDEIVDYYAMERLNLLACLISEGVLDIRIAYTENEYGMGMYHEKMGIIQDAEGNAIAFSGSMNESATAISVNYETIDVFRSWGDNSERERVRRKQCAFDAIWNNREPNICVRRFSSLTEEFIRKYKRKQPNFLIDNEQFAPEKRKTQKQEMEESVTPKAQGARVPKWLKLHDYQEDAIEAWVKEGYRGIYDMATGTGKTYTGLASIARLSEALEDKLAVVIVCPYQHLVEQWVEDILHFHIQPIIGYSASPQRDWKRRLERAIRNQKIRKDRCFFCFVCTNATFANVTVQKLIDKIRSPILLVVDEAHNFGARSYARLLDERFTYRLALSATLERHRDEEGTAVLNAFFGEKCIYYSLERAIQEEKLTPYQYYPVLTYLNEDELLEYESITREMSRCLIKGRNGKLKLNQYGELLAMKRARLVAGASDKIEVLREVIADYADKSNILVYCGATTVAEFDDGTTDAGELRQIEAVIRVLGNEFGMRVAQFTSQEKMETRAIIKEQFQREGGLQAIVAIKCLDEGVNIPAISTAFILASTTNPKEYIQRRGRVLRKAPNKQFAEIYDFVTLPRPLDEVFSLTKEQAQRDFNLVKNEYARVEEFGRLAMNPVDAQRLMWDMDEAYHITELNMTDFWEEL